MPRTSAVQHFISEVMSKLHNVEVQKFLLAEGGGGLSQKISTGTMCYQDNVQVENFYGKEGGALDNVLLC